MTPVTAALTAAAAAVLALAIVLGRLTAPSGAAVPQALVPVQGAATGLALPQLSPTAALPALAAAPAPAPKPAPALPTTTIPPAAPTTTIAPAVSSPRPTPKKKPSGPVVIVGSG